MPCTKEEKTKGIKVIIVDPCADECIPQLDQAQMESIYDMFNAKVRADLQNDFDCKKINGATFADTWAKIMGPTINGIMQSMVALHTNETSKDRCVKDAQCAKLSMETLEIEGKIAELLLHSGRQDCVTDAQCGKLTAETTEVSVKSTREDGLAAATNTLKGHQGTLYQRQAKGFDDNAFQKLFDSQLNSWSMVFADTDLSVVTPPLQNEHICDSFNRIKVGMGEASGTCEVIIPTAADAPSDIENLNTDNPEPTE